MLPSSPYNIPKLGEVVGIDFLIIDSGEDEDQQPCSNVQRPLSEEWSYTKPPIKNLQLQTIP